MVTSNDMHNKANKIADYYADLQQNIFRLIVDISNDTRSLLTDSDHMLEWRLKMLSKMGGLTNDTIKTVSKVTKVSQKSIRELIKNDGLQVADEINGNLSSLLNKKIAISDSIHNLINSYAHQTFEDIDNNVNQTLLSTNYSQNGADKAFQDIINKTVLETQTGLKAPERALADTIYKWRDNGIKSNLIDKGGHQWSLEGYTRTVITSTAHRTFNDVRIQSMKDFNSPLAVMSSHPAARRACAFIQGSVVNIVPPESPDYNAKYDSIYNYGYGTAAGTQGVNCRHDLYPYVEGVSHNFQEQYDPDEAQKNADIQQKQRYYERSIRDAKYKLDLANRLKDEQGQMSAKSTINNYQSKLRDIVKENDFLNRQYQRERIVK